MSSHPLIQINKLSHVFSSGKKAFEDINLSIAAGSFTVIGGENGSGKTVLMKHLNGILDPTEGEVLINGVRVQKDRTAAIRTVGLVFQNSSNQIVAQSVEEDIAFGPENLGLENDEIKRRVEELSGALNLSKILQQSPHRLSGGEKKKTAIAGVLAMEPELLVFDEPFAALDFSGVKMLLKEMLKLHREGKAVIVITHDLEKVLAHADTLVVMAEGRIAGSGRPSDMLETAAKHGLRVPAHGNPEKMSWLSGEI